VPRRKSSLADDLVLVPWWVSLILAIFAFVFLKAMPGPWAALIPLVLLFFLATSGLSALRSLKTARMLDAQTSLASIRERRGSASRICWARRFDGRALKLRRLSEAEPTAELIYYLDATGMLP
jgi:hypothetical protein